MRKLPKVLYARMEQDQDTEYPVTYEALGDAIDGDGPTLVGTYKLVETKKLRKVVHVDA